ncbi:MAG: putative sulfate exporter family transporter [Armatimonadota bacterium]|nr:putative sulfate exporter family transporter [Armatimonadota bacterium]
MNRNLLTHSAFFLAIAFCLTSWASPPLALALGLALALTLGNPYPQRTQTASKWLLQGCVVLLGFGMNLAVVLKAGASGAAFAAGSITLTFALGYWLKGRLQINRTTSALISAGTAICGGSAIAAVGSVVGAAEGEMTVAMGTVFVLNAVALFVFPPIGHALGLTQTQFGTWAGVAIHDVSSVVGAASRYGPSALQTATAVKLSRALWIVPVSALAALAFRRDAGPDHAPGKMHIPWFIGLFLLASVTRTLLPGVATLAPALTHLATTGLSLTLFLIGAGLAREMLKSVGWKPMAQGVALWLCISAGSLWVILRLVH